MRHKLLVLTVKKFLHSVYIYGSYRKIKTGVPFFWTGRPVYVAVRELQGSCGFDPTRCLQFHSWTDLFILGI